MKLLVEGVRIWSFCGKQLHPRWFFKIVAHQKRVMFCLYDSVDLPPVKGCEASSLLAPTKGPNAHIMELGRNDHFSERCAVEEHFFADLR